MAGKVALNKRRLRRTASFFGARGNNFKVGHGGPRRMVQSETDLNKKLLLYILLIIRSLLKLFMLFEVPSNVNILETISAQASQHSKVTRTEAASHLDAFQICAPVGNAQLQLL